MMIKFYKLFFYLILIILCTGCNLISSNSWENHNHSKEKEYDVTIYRDSWGVPHIFGKTDADAAYGLAYANAEDDFKNMQDAVLAARGTLASVYGKDQAPVWFQRWRIFFMACEVLFGFDNGIEWGVSHYRFVKPEK